jgi:hypothetical protein
MQKIKCFFGFHVYRETTLGAVLARGKSVRLVTPEDDQRMIFCQYCDRFGGDLDNDGNPYDR